jgi:hypothetical protein
MVDSAWLTAVFGEYAAGASELVVEGDGGGEAPEADENSFSEPLGGCRHRAFEGEEVFADPEDALDALADTNAAESTT